MTSGWPVPIFFLFKITEVKALGQSHKVLVLCEYQMNIKCTINIRLIFTVHLIFKYKFIWYSFDIQMKFKWASRDYQTNIKQISNKYQMNLNWIEFIFEYQINYLYSFYI